MNIAIIITTPDFAGLTIKSALLNTKLFTQTTETYEGVPVEQGTIGEHQITIYTTNSRCLYAEQIADDVSADLYLFPTTHRSAAATQSLCIHTQGNWGPADLGGKPNSLSVSPAIVSKKMFQLLYSYDLEEEKTLEVSHHGPELVKPCLFLEIGSDEEQWKREDLGKIWAEIIINTFENPLPKATPAIGIGGPHYCSNFNEIHLHSDIAIGHVCPKHLLHEFDEDMLMQAVERTEPRAELAVLDWKGLGSEKQRIVALLERKGIAWKKTKELKKNI